MPGFEVSVTCWTAKLTRSVSVPESSHSWPVCQPSTEVGFISAWPIRITTFESFATERSGKRGAPASLIAPPTNSTGLLTRRNRAALKNSEFSNVRITSRMSPFEAVNVAASASIAAGSRGGVSCQEGTPGSSATKKL